MSSDTKKIAIVGMGVAGVSALREWTKQKESDPSIEITLFGDETTFGRGVPYQKEDENLIMNQPAELATIIPEKKDDFVDWLKETQDEENPRQGYYPRQLFGSYLRERMDSWAIQSEAKIIKEKVERIQRLTNKKFRLTSSSTVEDFDIVHLCIGNFPYQDHYHLVGHPNFIIDPFPVKENLSSIPEGVRVGVLGSGLTSIDILRYLDSLRPDLTLSFFSKSGRFKTVRGESTPINYRYFTDENIKSEKEKNNGFISLDIYIKWFKKEMDHQQLSMKENWTDELFGSKESIKKELADPNEIGPIQTLLLGMDPFLTEIWMALTETDKQRFFDDYYELWDKIRTSYPIESGEKIVSLWEEDKFSVFADLMDVIEKEDSFELILKDQESQEVDYIVNAAGTEKDLTFEIKGIPLLRQLLNERILQPETFGGVQVSVPNLSAISQRYGVLNQFKVHGPLISGIQFGNNSVDIISEGVRTAVQDIVKESRI